MIGLVVGLGLFFGAPYDHTMSSYVVVDDGGDDHDHLGRLLSWNRLPSFLLFSFVCL